MLVETVNKFEGVGEGILEMDGYGEGEGVFEIDGESWQKYGTRERLWSWHLLS
jgi:hypothetical protein